MAHTHSHSFSLFLNSTKHVPAILILIKSSFEGGGSNIYKVTKGNTQPDEKRDQKNPLTSENSLLKAKSDLQKYKTGDRDSEASNKLCIQ